MEEIFGHDADHHTKAAWRSIRIPNTGKHLTVSAWRKFIAEYRSKRQWLDSCTQGEEYELIWSQLNPYWTQEITKRESDRNSKGAWVLIANIGETHPEKIQCILRALRLDFSKVERHEGNVRVRTPNESARSRLVKECNGLVANSGTPWRVTRTEIK